MQHSCALIKKISVVPIMLTLLIKVFKIFETCAYSLLIGKQKPPLFDIHVCLFYAHSSTSQVAKWESDRHITYIGRRFESRTFFIHFQYLEGTLYYKICPSHPLNDKEKTHKYH